MRTTTLLAIIAIIATVGAVVSVGFATMATPAHATRAIFDPDDIGHGQSFHDIKGDIHSHFKA
jgi:hypothetical protein